MLNFPVNSTDFRLLQPEEIWLKAEDFEQAKQMCNQMNGAAHLQWQNYLQLLALLAFEKWLNTHMPDKPVTRDSSAINYLKVGEFKICLLASEHLLDEVVNLPQDVVDNPSEAAHFYVVLEVLEEAEEVIVRGFLRYDELVNYCSKVNLQLRDGCYQLPLSLFDVEPNHLLYYSRFLEPAAISLPVAAPADNLLDYLQETRTKLSQWLQGVVDNSWQAVDALLNSEGSLAFSTRNIHQGTNRGKLINLGMQLGSQPLALLMTITPEAEHKLSVVVQLHPTGGERFLPPNIHLNLLSKAGKNIQEVTSRSEDNYIQLKPFKGEVGKRFSVEVSLGDASVREDFEL
jgi:hypothetical protein